jgi:membrane protease YdiL (CAAX protease family)
MMTEKHELDTTAIARPLADVGRTLFLALAMTVWADVNDRLAVRYHIGTAALIALRTIVDCGGVVWLGCIVWGKRSLRDLGWRFARPLRLVAIGVFLTAMIVAMIVGSIAMKEGRAGVAELATDFAAMSIGTHAYFGLLGVKIAFWEETLFRGDLLRALCGSMRTAFAVIASSAAFTAFHLRLDDFAGGIGAIFTIGLFVKFGIGVLFALATVRTRSLLPSAVGHALLWGVMGDL